MAPHRTAKPTILCASPDPGLLTARAQILKQDGYGVIAAADRHSAVLAAANHQVDLALICFAFSSEESEELEHDLLTVSPTLAIVKLQDYDGIKMKEEGHSPELLRQLVRAALRTHVSR